MYTRLINLLGGTEVSDIANGYRAIRASRLAEIAFAEDQFHNPELLLGAARAGLHVLDIPVTIRRRTAGTSKKGTNVRYGLGFLRVMLKAWLRWSTDGPARLSFPIRLSYLATPSGQVWNSTIHGMEASLARAGVRRRSVPDAAAWRVPAKVLARSRLVRPLFRRRENLILVPSMGFSEYRLVPLGYAFEAVPYVFDCWPTEFPRWDAFFRRHRPRVTFFSARDSAAYFRGRIPGMEAIWMPEATDPARYDRGLPLGERSLDVLELGRRYPAFHEAITQPLESLGRSHRYEAVPGRIIFPSFAELVDGLAVTRISICFPGSVTHPARSGFVETVTHRYFESMASRCLILGQCPDELADLFGYDPVIRGDMADPAGQILQILEDIGSYQSLVDRNHARLLEVGTWDVRVGEMLATLEDRGLPSMRAEDSESLESAR